MPFEPNWKPVPRVPSPGGGDGRALFGDGLEKAALVLALRWRPRAHVCSPTSVARPFRVAVEGVPRGPLSRTVDYSATFVDGVPSQLFRWTVRSGLSPLAS